VPLLIAGLGSGLVISPNVTLTLASVPVPRAGTAGGLLQTGQRIGTAAGIALIGAVYFGVSVGQGSTKGAVWALRVAAALVAVALVASAIDLRARRRPGQPTRDEDGDGAADADPAVDAAGDTAGDTAGGTAGGTAGDTAGRSAGRTADVAVDTDETEVEAAGA
jgi:MFS family permease